MPSSSKKQHNFMAAVAHSPEFAKKAGVPMSVGKDFVNADKAKKGTAMATKGKMPAFMAKDAKVMKPTKKYAAGGSVGGCRKSADGVVSRGKTRCKQVKMASGGSCK